MYDRKIGKCLCQFAGAMRPGDNSEQENSHVHVAPLEEGIEWLCWSNEEGEREAEFVRVQVTKAPRTDSGKDFAASSDKLKTFVRWVSRSSFT